MPIESSHGAMLRHSMAAVDDVRNWIERIVVGLDLCPFAQAPLKGGRVRMVTSNAPSLDRLMAEVMAEMAALSDPESTADTTLIVVPDLLRDFDDFLDAVALAEELIEHTGNTGTIQLAHFHPDYRFAGTEPDDPGNRTNQSPHPVLHLLRWADVREAMHTHSDVGFIPQRNEALMRGMGALPSLTEPPKTDFRAAIRADKFWDRHTQRIFDAHGEALEDCVLQNREEVIGLMEFIEAHNIRSYLEIGVWTGRLTRLLHREFRFNRVAVADERYAERKGMPIAVPTDADAFWGDSSSADFQAWRAELGHIDLVFIDGNHTHAGVCRDFAINRAFPHRFLAFHDITGANRWTTGVKKFWDELDTGHKWEICRPHAELGLAHSVMGIGIWSATVGEGGTPCTSP